MRARPAANVTVMGVRYPLFTHVHHHYGLNDAFDRSVSALLALRPAAASGSGPGQGAGGGGGGGARTAAGGAAQPLVFEAAAARGREQRDDAGREGGAGAHPGSAGERERAGGARGGRPPPAAADERAPRSPDALAAAAAAAERQRVEAARLPADGAAGRRLSEVGGRGGGARGRARRGADRAIGLPAEVRQAEATGRLLAGVGQAAQTGRRLRDGAAELPAGGGRGGGGGAAGAGRGPSEEPGGALAEVAHPCLHAGYARAYARMTPDAGEPAPDPPRVRLVGRCGAPPLPAAPQVSSATCEDTVRRLVAGGRVVASIAAVMRNDGATARLAGRAGAPAPGGTPCGARGR
jgi:hypothetical protein